jgi:hypothetical protein
MSRNQPLVRALAALVSVAPAISAGTLFVGPVGGGAQFSEIQDAIDAAQVGDVIVVAPGNYGAIAVDKPLRILGDGTGPVLVDGAQPIGAEVSGIAAGQEVYLSGLRIEGTPSVFADSFAVRVASCSGTVVLHDIVIEPGVEQVGVRVENCTRVMMLACRILDAGTPGTSAVRVTDSTLWIADSEVTGRTPQDDFHLLKAGAVGVDAGSATLHVWRSSLRGGNGNTVFAEAFGSPAIGGAGVAASASIVNLYGGPVGEVRGGDGGAGPFFGQCYSGAPGVDLTSGSVARVQASLSVGGGSDCSGANPEVPIRVDASSSFALDSLVFPTVVSDAQEVAVGGGFNLTLEGNPFGYQVLWVAFGTGPDIVLSGIEGIGVVDLGTYFQVASFFLPAGAATVLPLSIPPNPAHLGKTLLFQSAEALGLQAAISNPALVTVAS